ncbi:MAG: hypothetical protein ACXVA9_01380 [Bdellovibrionales bacterium]
MMTRFVLLLATALAGSMVWAAPSKDAAEPAVKYKAGKDLNFEQLVIEGQLKRPELAVVTGDSDEGANGLLRLRENFVDRMAESAGEEAP